MALRKRPCALSASLKQQRHITPNATEEVKLDGYRMIAVQNDKPELYSRLKNSNTRKFPEIVTALTSLSDGTVIDGELAALDNDGRPDFNLLQNYRSSEAHLVYFAFDILWYKGRSLLNVPLTERRQILRDVVKPNDRLQLVEVTTKAEDIVRFVKEQQLEGVIAKHADSTYLPGKRTSSWVTTHIARSQEFVVGGYTPSHLGLAHLG